MKNLFSVLDILKKKEKTFSGQFFIPEAWNFTGYDKYSTDEKRNGEVCINPYSFIAFCIEKYIIPEKGESYTLAAACKEDDQELDLAKNTIYSMLPRMFTAWEHYEQGSICSGTFLKAICRLPYLKKMNVDIIYLLPIFEYSNKYKKGEIGGPYAIKNIYRLDPNMHDPLLGDFSVEMIETEFKAFVEACHILGIKVMVDFVFRTVSRDNELIENNPDWFYWIDLKYNDSFMTPSIDIDKKSLHLNDKNLSRLYRSKDMAEYLKWFTLPPNQLNPDKWESIKKQAAEQGLNILDLIEKEYGITTIPGFSNVLNDPQPPWTDATFLKFYFDNHEKAAKFVEKDQPPYILQDGVCLNLYRGSIKNEVLWKYVSDVIPYYQENYGIDGARIDMGHALPPELNRDIVERTKSINKQFILWSEVFEPEKAQGAKDDGFHFISGFIWSIYKDIEKPSFNKKLFENTLMKSALPITAAMETPDTPRAAHVHKDKKKIELLLFLNCFIPNAVPFINNGFEAVEVQPMNLGLDNTEAGRFVLEKDDPMYGKLAFFDNYYIHWKNSELEWMQNLLIIAADLRKRFTDLISRKDLFIGGDEVTKNKKITFISYYDSKCSKYVFFVANRSMESRARIDLKSLIPEGLKTRQKDIKIIYQNGSLCDIEFENGKKGMLQPGEIIIGCLE
ncbi:MAG: alpha-amylase family glycosyl hydrolase [Clostridia bacterium]|nr:alpha-amylase family glycosyl hydrolase [Clostridia bacterium]